jgi:hypothetical protein
MLFQILLQIFRKYNIPDNKVENHIFSCRFYEDESKVFGMKKKHRFFLKRTLRKFS